MTNIIITTLWEKTDLSQHLLLINVFERLHCDLWACRDGIDTLNFILAAMVLSLARLEVACRRAFLAVAPVAFKHICSGFCRVLLNSFRSVAQAGGCGSSVVEEEKCIAYES